MLSRSLALALVVPTLPLVGCSSGDAPPLAGITTPDSGSDVEDAALESETPASCTSADDKPSTGPSGYLLDGWHWTRLGVVLEDPGAAAQDGYISPAALVQGETLHVWFARKQGLQHRIQHTSSVDGATFAAPEPTSGLQGEDVIAYPSVVQDGARLLMWYGSGSIDLAQSTDGVSWTMIQQAVLGPGDSGAFDSLTVLYPNVSYDGSTYVMYYTGYNGGAFAVGRAQSSDGISWTRTQAAPVLQAADPASFDNHAVAQSSAFHGKNDTLLWYGGYDTAKSNPGPYRVGLARSKDGISFARAGVTLDLEASGKQAWSTRDPVVVRWKGAWWMVYTAMGDDGRYRIALATSDTCE